MAAKVTFNSDRCKGCELCTAVCPKHIVVIDNSVSLEETMEQVAKALQKYEIM